MVVVEDCGRVINPLVVDGQVQGGVAQGIGSALLEEFVYDAGGQLLTTTLVDYLLPTTTDVPFIEVHHLETPSPFTINGIKGTGEGGAIGPAAAIVAAVEDAIRPLTTARAERSPSRPSEWSTGSTTGVDPHDLELPVGAAGQSSVAAQELSTPGLAGRKCRGLGARRTAPARSSGGHSGRFLSTRVRAST